MRVASLVSSVGFLSLVLAFSCSSSESDRTGDQAGVGGSSTGCVPKTCAELGANCGSVGDGCGALIECGVCVDGQTCGAAGPNACGVGTCTPKDCATQGFSCGQQGDTCGNALTCGECAGACVAGVCQVAGTGGTGTGTGGVAGTGAVSGSGAASGTGGSVVFEPGGATCETFGSAPLDTVFANEYAAWKSSQLETCGAGVRVKGCPAADASGTCSEAMGYGMLLAVGANDKTTFDQLNTYRLEMLKASSTSDKSLMPWAIWAAKSCPPTATGGDQNSATDGDIDAAMALLQAEQRWGGGTYKPQALTTLASVMALEVSGSGASIRLDPGNQEGDLRDYVAYYTPAYFAVFAEVTGETKWTDLTNAYYTRLLAQQCAANGQIYDDFQYPSGDCKFWWDSCRVPWRVALDYAWHQDTRAKQFLDKLEGFVGSDPSAISDQKNSAFAGAAVLSAISNDDGARMQELCNAWATAGGLDDSPYFQKTLRLLYMMVASGSFVRPN